MVVWVRVSVGYVLLGRREVGRVVCVGSGGARVFGPLLLVEVWGRGRVEVRVASSAALLVMLASEVLSCASLGVSSAAIPRVRVVAIGYAGQAWPVWV